jgi:hypothetical protein
LLPPISFLPPDIKQPHLFVQIATSYTTNVTSGNAAVC